VGYMPNTNYRQLIYRIVAHKKRIFGNMEIKKGNPETDFLHILKHDAKI
jgi:hypothetical protein